jgi:hypothetical protein
VLRPRRTQCPGGGRGRRRLAAGQLSEAKSVLTALGDELAPEAVVQRSLRRALNTHLQGRTGESVITESGFEAMRAFLAAGGADFSAALHAADAALASPAPSDFSVLLATVAKVIALGTRRWATSFPPSTPPHRHPSRSPERTGADRS